MPVRITEIEPSAWTVAHVSSKHGLTLDDIDHAVENRVLAQWDDNEEHGRRLLVLGSAPQGRLLRIWLYPVDEAKGKFRLGTAYPVTG